MRLPYIILGLLLTPFALRAETLLPIVPGITHLNSAGDLELDTIVKAWRGNGNAHGYFVIEFLRHDRNMLNIIGIQGEGDSIRTSQGADCVLTDYRLKIKDSQTYLIKADREYGNNFADSRKVTFSFYKLTRNAGDVGGPEYNFTKFKDWISSNSYCDVGDAFEKEKLSFSDK